MYELSLNKAYVSEDDLFLLKLDASLEKTASQLKEIAKHQKIAALRDHAMPNAEEHYVDLV